MSIAKNLKNKSLTEIALIFIAIEVTFLGYSFYSSFITYPTPRTVLIILTLKTSSIFVLKYLT